MRRVPLVFAFLLFASPGWLRAQEPGVEIGARVGVNFLFDGGTLITAAGGSPSPIGATLGTAAFHVGFFPSENVMVEPLLGLGIISVSNGASETFTNLTLAVQGAYLFNGARINSAYVGVTGAFNSLDLGAGSETDFAVGGTIGYRMLPRPNTAIRLELGFRRWLDFEISEIDAAVIFGIIL